MSSPYAERFKRALTISMTDKQFEHLQAYCIKKRVSLSFALRDAFFTLHPIPETDEKE